VAGTGYAVGIDLGTSNTVAILRWPDGRTRPLLVDGRPVLPSAVYVDGEGNIHAGRDAERMAQVDPGGYEPNPKRRIDDGAVLLGGRELAVADLLAAVLRAVARAAAEAVGFLPAAVLTYPASWGSLRRQTLQDAAARAGWPQVRLLPEPVAAARYFTDVIRRPVPPGATIAVFDFGGGTLDVALVRREGPDFAVVGWGGAEDLGGLDIDAALVGHLGRQLELSAPEAWRQISAPANELDRRHRRQFWDEARAAKEMLSRTTVATVAVPGVSGSLHVTRDELEELARPLIRRGVAEMAATVGRSRLSTADLSVVFLVGGASRIPLVAQTLHTELGIAPTVLEQPELPVAEGALADLMATIARTTRPAPAGPVGPPSQRMPAVPPQARHMPAVQPAMIDPRTGTPVTGLPVSGMPLPSLPVSATPAASMPVSAIPMSPMTRSMTAYPPPPPPAGRKRRRRAWPVVLTVLLLVAGCAGGGLYYVYTLVKPRSTFQDLAQAGTIPVDGMQPDAYADAFLTAKKAHAVTQVGREVDVATLDLATKTLKRQKAGSAAKWSRAYVLGDFVVVLAEPENGKRQLVGVNNVDGTKWATTVGADGILAPTGSTYPDNAPAVLWLDRQSNTMTYLSSATGKPGGSGSPLPAGWQLFEPAGVVSQPVLVTAGGAVWQVGADQPKKIATGVADGAPVSRMHLNDVAFASPQEEYPVSYVEGGYGSGGSSATPKTLFRGPANRKPLWIGGCRQSSSVCVIDQIGTDPSTREFAQYNTLRGTQEFRTPVPDADPTQPPQFLGQYGELYTIVTTRKEKEPAHGSVVLSRSGAVVGSYQGSVVAVDENRALLVSADPVAGAVSATISGLDLDTKLEKKLGTVTVRPDGCSWSTTTLFCPTTNDYQLWQFAK